jgi:hypothetical protein
VIANYAVEAKGILTASEDHASATNYAGYYVFLFIRVSANIPP